jgi:hypothetical protein
MKGFTGEKLEKNPNSDGAMGQNREKNREAARNLPNS